MCWLAQFNHDKKLLSALSMATRDPSALPAPASTHDTPDYADHQASLDSSLAPTEPSQHHVDFMETISVFGFPWVYKACSDLAQAMHGILSPPFSNSCLILAASANRYPRRWKLEVPHKPDSVGCCH